MKGKKNVFILVGPTGVGKTTTVTKMAALALQSSKKPELITIDGFRIGAKYQLEKYAEIMQLKISSAENSLDLERIVTLSESDMILIDTIGRSQSDELELAKMKNILKMKSMNAHFILTVSATTKPREIKKIFKNFDVFDYENIIVTKNDESKIIGSILDEAVKREKGIVYITTGQKVPDHIEEATVPTIMERIEGFEPTVYLTNASY